MIGFDTKRLIMIGVTVPGLSNYFGKIIFCPEITYVWSVISSMEVAQQGMFTLSKINQGAIGAE